VHTAHLETRYKIPRLSGSARQSQSRSAGGYDTRGLVPLYRSLDSASPLLPTTCQAVRHCSAIKVTFNLAVHSLVVIQLCKAPSPTRILSSGIQRSLTSSW